MRLWLRTIGVFGLLAVLCGSVEARRKVKVEIQLLPGACSPKEGCILHGRLVRYSNTIANNEHDRRKRINVQAGWRRFTRRSVKRKWVDIQFQGQRQRTRSGHHGLFVARFAFPTDWKPSLTPRRVAVWGRPIVWGSQSGTLKVSMSFPKQGRYLPTSATGSFVISRSHRGLSIVSDLDDTLIVSHAYSKRKVVKKAFAKHASQIPVVPDARLFLRSMLAGKEGGGSLHYVSSSPFAIVDRVLWLFHHRNFPVGDVHLSRVFRAHHYVKFKSFKYKVKHISTIFRRNPHRRFLLLGDSGEKDPDVYAKIRKLFPKQVAGIFIRHVPTTKVGGKRYHKIFTFKTYRQALQEARRRGWLSTPSSLPTKNLALPLQACPLDRWRVVNSWIAQNDCRCPEGSVEQVQWLQQQKVVRCVTKE